MDSEEEAWVPFCGKEYPIEKTAGVPIVCTLTKHDPKNTKHFHEGTGFQWWDMQSSWFDTA